MSKKKKLHIFEKQPPLDYSLLAVVVLLICFGLIMLYSASSYEGVTKHKSNDMFFFTRQAIFFVASIAASLVISRIDYHVLIRFAPAVYWGALFLMALVKTPLGLTINGARRWLGTQSFSFQPSEFAKIGLILMLAAMIVRFGKYAGTKRNLTWLVLAVILQFAGAFVLTDNLSTGIIIFTIGMGILLVYYPKLRHLLVLALIGAVLLAIVLVILKYFVDPSKVESFRVLRVINWLNRESNTSSANWQVTQGLYAIGSGGIFGKGLGNSTQKFTRVPEAQNDMIFSIICEEMGLFGAVLLLILFGYLLYRLFDLARNAQDLYGSIITTGILIHFSLQIVLNIAVVSGVIPTTGVSLPFVSYGGTAIMFLMGEIGICLNISRGARNPEGNSTENS